MDRFRPLDGRSRPSGPLTDCSSMAGHGERGFRWTRSWYPHTAGMLSTRKLCGPVLLKEMSAWNRMFRQRSYIWRWPSVGGEQYVCKLLWDMNRTATPRWLWVVSGPMEYCWCLEIHNTVMMVSGIEWRVRWYSTLTGHIMLLRVHCKSKPKSPWSMYN